VIFFLVIRIVRSTGNSGGEKESVYFYCFHCVINVRTSADSAFYFPSAWFPPRVRNIINLVASLATLSTLNNNHTRKHNNNVTELKFQLVALFFSTVVMMSEWGWGRRLRIIYTRSDVSSSARRLPRIELSVKHTVSVDNWMA